MNLNILKSLVIEYGLEWSVNRFLYSAKLKMIQRIHRSEKLFEPKVLYPKRLDIFSINQKALSVFLSNLDIKYQEDLVNQADKICNGIIRGFSSVDLNYGQPLDWQLNPLTGERVDERKKWYEIPDFDTVRGDIKVIWEASRFSHFITLARAYFLSKEERYYQDFSDQLDDWIDKNSYSYGANYKCGQECSIRMVNCLISYSVFHSAGLTDEKDKENVETLVLRCYRRILSNFFYAYKCIKNNHTISELMGMLVGAWCCDDMARIEYTKEKLNEVVDEQFTSDGGYIQFSFNYERLALQVIEVLLSIEGVVGKIFNDRCRKKIKNAVLLMYQCQDESYDMPNYGSNDGALVFPVTSCGYRDFRPTVNCLYSLLTGNSLYDSGIHEEELLWFGYEITPVKEVIKQESKAFNDAGLFTLRNDKHWCMLISNDYKTRPSHMDQLHFDLWIDGVNVLCDSGTYSYSSELGGEMINNTSHNTVSSNLVSQMNLRRPFFVYNWSKRKCVRHSKYSMNASIESRNGYKHRRKVKYSDDRYEIIDTVIGNQQNFQVRFHTPCVVEAVSDNEIQLLYAGRVICVMKFERDYWIENAKRSLYYEKCEDINDICFNISGDREIVKTIIIIGRL